MNDWRQYFKKCRCCLEQLPQREFLEVHEYFEDLFLEITGVKLISNERLSKKICFPCNETLGKFSNTRRSFIEKQQMLLEMIGKPIDTLVKSEVNESVVKEEVFENDANNCLDVEIKEEEDIWKVDEDKFEESEDEEENEIETEPRRRRKSHMKKNRRQKRSDKAECPHCHKVFTRTNDMKRHIIDIHENKKLYHCTEQDCSFNSFYKGEVTTHLRKFHKIFKSFVCEICAAKYNTSNKLKAHHISKHLQTKNFGCDICGSWFFEKRTIRSHMLIHKADRPRFKCDYAGCTKEATTIYILRAHKRAVHEMVREFECHCGRKFANKGGLDIHVKGFHNKIKDFKCDLCEKLFTTSTFLKIHKETFHPADGKRPEYPCEMCGVIFSTAYYLNQHTKVHGEPQFECHHCHKKFFRKGNLLDHQEHHETLAFPCPHCTRSFRTEAMLNSHFRKVHFKEKTTYRCELCSSTFTRRTTYRDHVLRQHKDLDTRFRNELIERIAKMLPEEKSVKTDD